MDDPAHARSITECVAALRKSSRCDLVASLAGVVTFSLGFWACHRLERIASPGLLASLALLVLSPAAGALSAARAHAAEIPAHLLGASATRLGARVGALVFLIGGGLFLLGLMARQVAGGIAPGDFSWFGTSLSGVSGIMLVLLPAVALGACGAILGLGQVGAPSPAPPSTGPPLRTGGPATWSFPLAISVFVGSLLSPLLPVALAGRSLPAAANGSVSGSVSGAVYSPPAGLDSADASKWRIVASRQVPGLGAGCAAAHSRDSRFLAFAPSNSGLTVFDLRRGEVAVTFQTRAVGSLAWSPSGERIFCVADDEDRSCWVLDRGSGAVIGLPVRGRLPSGRPLWESEGEIRFFHGATQTGLLDLEELRSRSLPERDPGPETLATDWIAETALCRLSIRPKVRSLTSPLEAAGSSWSFEASPALCAVDRESRRTFPLLDEIWPGTTLLTSPDSSMITVVTSVGATTHYIGLAEETRAIGNLDVDLPPLPRHSAESRLGKLAGTGRIGIFVCAPLLNPLTGKVIGPDPRQVRALAFLGGWDEGRGNLTIVESYSPVLPGDVAGYPHHWRGGHPSLLYSQDLEGWWAVARQPTASRANPVAPSLPWQQANLTASAGGVVFEGWHHVQPDGSHPPVANLLQLAGDPPRPAESSAEPAPRAVPETPLPATSPAAKPEDPAAAIRAFVASHHGKVGLGDIDGFVKDYAATVDLNDRGPVTPDFIRKDQSTYIPKYDRLSETIEGPVQVVATETGWRAIYAIRSFAVSRRDGKEHDRKVSITLDLRANGSGSYEIHRERAGATD